MLTNKGDYLLAALSNYNLKQMINTVQGNLTLIDVVFVIDVKLFHKTRVVDCPESNHCLILKFLNLKPENENRSTIKTCT